MSKLLAWFRVIALIALVILPQGVPQQAVAQASSGLPAIGSIVSVKSYGATGNGSTVDATAIGAALTANPHATIYFPPGTYLLNNAAGASGLSVGSGFTGRFFFAPGASLSCNTATSSAGDCVDLNPGAGFVWDGGTITYTGIGSLPLARNVAIGYTLLYEGNNITFNNLTITGGTGPCMWTGQSNNVFISNLVVSKCTADGLHFENSSDVIVDGYNSLSSGDDAMAWTSATAGPTEVCGGTVTNVHILNSLARGIAIAGGCNVTITNFNITNTAASGLYIEQESSPQENTTFNVKFSDGFVKNAGILTVGNGNQFGLEINDANNVDIDNVQFLTPSNAGVAVNGSSFITVKNSLIQGAVAGNGFNINTCSHCNFDNDRVDTVPNYGWYSTLSSDVNITNLSLRNVYTANASSLNRAYWNEVESGQIVANGVTIIDDQATATGWLLGGFNNGSANVITTGIQSFITNSPGSVFLDPSGDVNELYVFAAGNANVLTTATGSANAQALTPHAQAVGNPVAGFVAQFFPVAANTGAATLNYDAYGAATIVKANGQALAAGDLQSFIIATVIFDGSAWQLQNPQSVPGSLASVHQTAKTGAITTATLCASSAGACNVAGQYEVNISMIQTGTACSSVTAGQVIPSITWTDTNGVTHSAVIPQLLQQTTATGTAYASTGLHFETANANASASGTYIISTNGAVIQYATAYTACTTGTGTYQLDMSVNRVQ